MNLLWGGGQPLSISFEDRGSATLVTVHVSEFAGDAPAAAAIETMSGFTLVLASLKMYLEYGIEGDLMYDKFQTTSTPTADLEQPEAGGEEENHGRTANARRTIRRHRGLAV